MQRVTPQAASRTPVVRPVVFFVLACATMLSWNGRPAKAADVDMQVDDAARRCAGLGAMKVTEALLIAPESTNPTLEYCRVRATIAAAQASDPSILYQITAQSMELQNGPTAASFSLEGRPPVQFSKKLPMTLSPGLKSVVPDPTASTIPAPSERGIRGSF